MNIIPAIDLLNGKCVRLLKGNYSDVTIYNEDPIEQVKIFKNAELLKSCNISVPTISKIHNNLFCLQDE